MHLWHTILQQAQVTVVVEQPGLHARDVLGQSLAVTERHHQVMLALQQQHRDSDVR
jgi:hypothetical protein